MRIKQERVVASATTLLTWLEPLCSQCRLEAIRVEQEVECRYRPMHEDIRFALSLDGASLAVIDGDGDTSRLPNGPKHEPIVSTVAERGDAVTANEFPNELRLLLVVRLAVE